MMFKQFWGYFLAWVKGDEAELNVDIEYEWSFIDSAIVLGIVGLLIWRIWW